MDKHRELEAEALKYYQVADHLLNVTYPLVKDTKLLVGVTENIFLSLISIMSALLYQEKNQKQLPFFEDNFSSKFNLFKSQCLSRHHIPLSYAALIQELKELILLHRSSPIEFRRNDRFIICTNNYKVQAITYYQLKDYLKKTKEFLELISQTLSKNERISV